MHRLQISLPKTQMQYLARRARREGASVAELLRRMIQRETEAARSSSVDSLWEIVGIGLESQPLTSGIPVSERPDLYLADIAAPRTSPRAKQPRRRRTP